MRTQEDFFYNAGVAYLAATSYEFGFGGDYGEPEDLECREDLYLLNYV
jgi:hypothetical protein